MKDNKDNKEQVVENEQPNVEDVSSDSIINKEEVEQNQEKVSKMEEELSAEKDKYVRLFAEFDNYRKRTQKEKIESYKYANTEMITALLPVVDDFERAISELEKDDSTEVLDGIKLIHQKLNNTLKEKGLLKIEVNVGDDFDVEFHEAITKIPAPSEELKDKVVDIVETGYQIADKVIRFTKVVIGK